jgi:hypothetical protein
MPPTLVSLSAGSLSLASATVLKACLASPSSVLVFANLTPGSLPSILLQIRVVERVEHVDQTVGEVINIKHLFNVWRV